jgi:hypothetical protein
MTGGGRLLLILASIAMVAAALAGLRVLGSPSYQRALRLDDARVSGLDLLSNGIHEYWTKHDALPADLGVLPIANHLANDPVSGKPYLYKRLNDGHYDLCASFDVASEDQVGEAVPHMYVPTGPAWKHTAGPYCFHFQAESQGWPID